ncbi:MAG: alpha-1,2-fucosyltransferase [Quinella sp. 1Q7]|nr:alpha-1,2-fucosyltransferase [Quinella sp. 1Q7]
MIISYIISGIGNQLYQYAAGLRLARKHKTQLKLDTTYYAVDNLRSYALDQFNITATVATPDEIQRAKKILERDGGDFMPEVLDCPDNVWLYGYWQHEEYFADVADELRREFTLRQSLGATAQRWREKISAAQCSVSVHVRHGDFIYNPINATFAVLPLKYYRDCIDRLKREHSNIKLFVFSDDLNWCRENFRFGVPIEFVTGDGLTDVEELYLMSTCQHNVIANSTFSWWAAWLNHNPNKKVFAPDPWARSGLWNNGIPASWTKVPVNYDMLFDETEPLLSIIVYASNNAATLPLLLTNILNQTFKDYELILIDDASTDGTADLCRQAASNRKVTLITSENRVGKAAAWNFGLEHARGKFVMFLRGNDCISKETVHFLCKMYLSQSADVICSVQWLKENPEGNMIVDDIADKKFSHCVDEQFKSPDAPQIIKSDDLPNKLLAMSTQAFNLLLGTKFFRRDFLLKNSLRFNENAVCDVELPFVVNAVLFSEELFFTPDLLYIEPNEQYLT